MIITGKWDLLRSSQGDSSCQTPQEGPHALRIPSTGSSPPRSPACRARRLRYWEGDGPPPPWVCRKSHHLLPCAPRRRALEPQRAPSGSTHVGPHQVRLSDHLPRVIHWGPQGSLLGGTPTQPPCHWNCKLATFPTSTLDIEFSSPTDDSSPRRSSRPRPAQEGAPSPCPSLGSSQQGTRLRTSRTRDRLSPEMQGNLDLRVTT